MSEKNLISVIDEDIPSFCFFPGENDGRYPNSHSLVIKTSEKNNEAILFDSGTGHALIKKLLQNFKITKVVLSHWHEDHVSGNYLLKQQQQSEFFCHSLDAEVLNDVSKFQVLYGTVGTPVADYFQQVLTSLNLDNLSSIQELEDNRDIEIDETLRIKTLHTPGHSAGHCCFLEPENRVIFLADIDLSGLGPWYGCLDSNVDDFDESLQRLMEMDFEYAISSHKGIFKGKTEIRNQIKDYHAIIVERDEKILEELSEGKPKTLEDLIGKRIIYKQYNNPWKNYLLIAENLMISKHITRLTKKEKISKQGEKLILL
ncbi:MAG: MBL fold metallo-hydrolase [Candidatus Odinarchaeota archaeon]